MKKPQMIPKQEQVLKFWDHLQDKFMNKKIKRRDLVLIGILIFSRIKKVEILRLTVNDHEIKANLKDQRVEDLQDLLKKHIRLYKELDRDKLFPLSYRHIGNIMKKYTKVFFDKELSPSVFQYVKWET